MKQKGDKVPRKPNRRIGTVAILAGFGAVTIAAPALASGAGAEALASAISSLSGADGINFDTLGPVPTLGAGVSDYTHTRGYFTSTYFNDVGFANYGTSAGSLNYEISDTNGNYIYTVPGYQYTGGDSVEAAFWHNSGNSWHYNWWDSGANINVGVDANNAYASSPGFTEATVGADGWGGCPNGYPVNGDTYWIYRYASNASWYYFPSDTTFAWGNTPTWAVTGDAANGGGVNPGTVSCP